MEGNFDAKHRSGESGREGFLLPILYYLLRTYSQCLRICFFQMEDVSKEYSLEMILNHEPTEAGRKNRELGIDGQCFRFSLNLSLLACLCGLGFRSECLHIFVSFNRRASGIILFKHIRVFRCSCPYWVNGGGHRTNSPFLRNIGGVLFPHPLLTKTDAVSLIISGK